jgi:regulator of sigma E protease
MITSIVAAVVIFAVLIIVHEAGHFAVAKRLGVRVLRFSIGYPPRIFGIRRGETDYAIGATPLGGYVRMLGDEIADEPSAETIKGYLRELELDLIGAARSTGWLERHERSSGRLAAAVDDNSSLGSDPMDRNGHALVAIANAIVTPGVGPSEPDRAVAVLGREARVDEMILLREVNRLGSVDRAMELLPEARLSALLERFNARAFPSQRLAKRFAIVLAGPAANIIFAPILMIIVFMIGVPTMLPVLGAVKDGMPGYEAGLRSGDRIISVNGTRTETWEELSRIVKASNGTPLKLAVDRPMPKGGSKMISLLVTPKLLPEETIYGNKAPTWVIGVTPRGDEITRSFPPLEAVKAGGLETGRMITTLCIGIGKIFNGATPVRQALGGPIMIAQIAGKEAHQGFADVALFTVMLSLELGIINLLPVPLLDGGHLLFFIIEGVRGKPLQLRHREIAMQVGLFLLMVLMAFVIMNDISRIIG